MGSTAVFYSLCAPSLSTFYYLIEHSNLNHKNMNKETPLFSAVEKGIDDAVDALIKKKVDLN